MWFATSLEALKCGKSVQQPTIKIFSLMCAEVLSIALHWCTKVHSSASAHECAQVHSSALHWCTALQIEFFPVCNSIRFSICIFFRDA